MHLITETLTAAIKPTPLHTPECIYAQASSTQHRSKLESLTPCSIYAQARSI